MTIIIRISYIIAFAASIIFLGEVFTGRKIIAVVLIALANLLISPSIKHKKIGRNIWYAIGLAVTLGLGWTFDKIASNAWGISQYIFLSFLSPAIVSSLFPVISKNDIRQEIKNTPWYIVILSALNVLGYYFFLKAFSLGEASRVILVSSFAQILTIVSGIIFLKEHSHIPRKLIAGTIALIAIILINS